MLLIKNAEMNKALDGERDFSRPGRRTDAAIKAYDKAAQDFITKWAPACEHVWAKDDYCIFCSDHKQEIQRDSKQSAKEDQ